MWANSHLNIYIFTFYHCVRFLCLFDWKRRRTRSDVQPKHQQMQCACVYVCVRIKFTQKSFYGHFIICFPLLFCLPTITTACLHEEGRIFNSIERQLKPMSKVSVIDIMIHVYGMDLLAISWTKMRCAFSIQ